MSIEVVVKGQRGAGKTTVARCILGALRLLDFEVRMDDDDEHPELHGKRIAALKGTKVYVQTKTVM